jgi:hypothetical protein|tara:strand:- start:162 stop:371 length:210 start_codon:yes stop_codon:yes gene_type:complete
MRDKLNGIGIVIGVIGVIACIPMVIRGLFWILLQMFNYPLTTIVIVGNLLIWQYLYIRATENNPNKPLK